MAVLSAPSNIPTLDGAVIGCTTDDTSGTAYAMARIDRQWYFEVSADPLVTQEMIDADKATIIAQDITAPELVWAGTDEDLATIQLTIDGLAARLDPANPYYVGWVQTPPEPMIFTVSIANPLDTFTVPCSSVGTEWDAYIDWGDGTESGNIIAFDSVELGPHEYTDAGEYEIKIRGKFPNIYFNNTGDIQKVVGVSQLGDTGLESLDSAFFGCGYILTFKAAPCNTPLLTSLRNFLRTTPRSLDVDVSGINTASVANHNSAIRSVNAAISFTGTSSWDISSMSAAATVGFAQDTDLGTAEYDATLIAWEAQPSRPSGITITFGSSIFTTPGPAQDAFDTLTLDGWVITDGNHA